MTTTTSDRLKDHSFKVNETKKKPKRKPRPKRKPKVSDDSYLPALAGVGIMLTLSALLNGYANAKHSPVAWAGWGMGIVTPVIVLILAKVAGGKWRAGQQIMAHLAGWSGVGLLLLSVWHCAESITTITGSQFLLSVPMAVAIDIGLISCELAIITRK